MTAQIVKWGNSQGIRLPKIILDEAGLAPLLRPGLAEVEIDQVAEPGNGRRKLWNF